MYPFSAIASAIAVYQLNSMVGNECVQYARGVQNAEKDGDIVIGELDRFQKSLINLKGMLAEDEEDKGNTSCLEHLDEVMDGTFVSLRIC
jgi:ethanolamine utilization microcompartment shell protein EutS